MPSAFIGLTSFTHAFTTMSLSTQLAEEIKNAMKAKDTVTLNTVRALKSALKYGAIEKHGPDGDLDDADALVVVRREIKKRQDSVAQYEAGGRPELAASEQAEIAVLEKYLPAAMSSDDVAKLIDTVIAETGATSKKDMGKVMKLLQERSGGTVDNKTLSTEVNKRLQ